MLALKAYMEKAEKYQKKDTSNADRIGDLIHSSLMLSYLALLVRQTFKTLY